MSGSCRLMELASQCGAKMIDLKFTDLAGRFRHVTVPIGMLTDKLLSSGVGVDGSSVGGFSSVEFSDLRIVPDPDTAWLDMFWREPTVSVICDIVHAGTDTPFALDPRGVARAAERHLVASGIATGSEWGPEPEFYLFEGIHFDTSPGNTHVRIDDGKGDDGYLPAPGGGYDVTPPGDRYHDVRSEMVQTLEAAGIPVKYHHSENGVPGQSEIEPEMMPLVQAADAVMILKYIVKNVAVRRGLTATFMPKPLAGEAGSGMHVHQRLHADGKPVFHSPDGYARLSGLALSYIGGLLEKSASLAAIIAPTTNSYRRLIPGFEAPTAVAFSEGNRTACVRIPAYATDPNDKRIEYRPPDPTANPYLAMAAMLMAGLWGVKEGVDPEKRGFGPYDVNVYEMAGVASLPGSLGEALTALDRDHSYLIDSGVFSPELLANLIKQSRTEMQAIRSHPHPLEFSMYYDC